MQEFGQHHATYGLLLEDLHLTGHCVALTFRAFRWRKLPEMRHPRRCARREIPLCKMEFEVQRDPHIDNMSLVRGHQSQLGHE